MSDEITSLTKEDGQSKDLVKENVEKLKQLFPEIVTDGKIDFETLKEELGEFRETSDERYSFTWNGKSKSRKLAMETSRGTLRPMRGESINWNSSNNLYIEGENLEVLKLLQRSYHKKVKLIYIDPPYNRGDDLIYRDDYQDNLKNYLQITGQLDGEGKKLSSNSEKSGRYHTDWLNMIYPRLKLAKELLHDDGLIIASIDDHEVHDLMQLMNEVFGEENALIPFIWHLPRGINAGHISKAHEYFLVYAKNKDKLSLFNRMGDTEYSVERCNKKVDRRHPASDITFPAGIKYVGPDQTITGEIPGSERIEIKGEMVFKDGKLSKEVTLSAGWTMKDMILDWLDGKDVTDTKDQEIEEFFFKENGKLYSKKKLEYDSPKSVLLDVPDTQAARKEIEEIMGSEDVFSYPKPAELMKILIDLTTNEGDLVMDFFAGSCSTGHGFFKAEAENNLSRKLILVQLPEPISETDVDQREAYDLCESLGLEPNISELGKERLRRVINKLEETDKNDEADLGFKVFKLDTSNIKTWDPSFDEVQLSIEDSIENVKPDRSELDLLYEVLLKYGIDLSLPIEERTVDGSQVYIGGAGALVLCPSDNITLEVVEGIAEIKEEFNPEIMRVVFRDSGFKDDVVKTNAIQILKQHGIEDVKSI